MHARTRLWATISLVSLLPILFAAKLRAQYDPNDPPASIARISYLDGSVSLQAAGTDDWSQAPINYPMIGGDRLYTGPGSRALVQLGGAELRVWQATDVTLTNITDQYEQIGLAAGSIRLRVFQMDPGSQIEVDTPNGAAIIETPGDYRIESFPQNNVQDASSIVTVNSGSVQLTGPNINLPLNGGYSVGLFGTNPVELQYLAVPDYDDLDYWSISLDQRLQNSVSARYVSREMVGYADLDANGTWFPDSEYGPVWYPNNVPYGWQPYSTGHWAYVSPWGYTWVDDAPWGFAPFHYGRWSQINGRWGWFPGPPAVRPVYSPALVAFVGGGPGLSISIGFGGGGGIAAWFPIGVGEPYVPWYRCSPAYARQVNVTNVNVALIRNTTIVNNYNTYITKTVINNTTINNTTVNNFNYANRTAVTAVPANAMASGASVSRQAVRLTPEQQQQIARAPISVRPTAPVPATPHPSLVAAANVARPAARPTLMTPTGQARAVPSAARPHPVAISQLPPARIVPRNAPPPPAAPKPIPQHISPAMQQPRPNQQPATAQPARTAPVPASRPTGQPTAPTRSSTPVEQAQPAPVARPDANQPARVTRPSAPESQPVPSARPETVTRPAQPAQAPVERPTPPQQRTAPPAAAPAPVVRQPQQRPPAPQTEQRPPAKPAPKPGAKPDAKDKEKEKERPKEEHPN